MYIILVYKRVIYVLSKKCEFLSYQNYLYSFKDIRTFVY